MKDTFDAWWDKAEAMAGDRLAAVKRSRLQWRYIRLMLHPDAEEGRVFRADVDREHIRWGEWHDLPAEPDYSLPPHKWFAHEWYHQDE